MNNKKEIKEKLLEEYSNLLKPNGVTVDSPSSEFVKYILTPNDPIDITPDHFKYSSK
jgi:hypothetical protein|nr:MAG TPA: hypothetical protein [Caudoviricetes sp.]